jgi:hypothetical protein
MASTTLPASAEFFKQLSLECQQLRITLQLLDTLAFRALVRGRMLNDPPLLLILEQMEICVSKAQDFMDDLEILSEFGL